MEYYGVTVQEGVVVEESAEHYVYGSPVMLMPDMESSEITDPLISDNYNVIMPVSKSLDLSNASSDVTAVSLLESSDQSFLKAAGYDITTYEKEEGDTEGPLTLAAMITKDLEDDRQMQIVWIASSELLNEEYNSLSSDANEDFVLNALEMMCEKDNSISVRSKSLSYEYLTISSGTSSYIKVLTIAVIPAVYLLIGIFIVVRRKRR
jgi:ABC-2 type transport system permease protein